VVIATEALPGETASLASAIEPPEHQPLHGPRKAVQRRVVVGHADIIEVTPVSWPSENEAVTSGNGVLKPLLVKGVFLEA
jgi:hypothetical protein